MSESYRESGSLADDSFESEYITQCAALGRQAQIANDDDWLYGDDEPIPELDFGEFGVSTSILQDIPEEEKVFVVEKPNKYKHLVPDFDDTVSNVALNPFLHAIRADRASNEAKAEMIFSLLSEKGWPAFRIKSIMSTFLRAKDTHKRSAQLTAISDRKKVQEQFLDDIVKKRKPVAMVLAAPDEGRGNGVKVEHWRVPYDRATFEAYKPTSKNFTQVSYRKWASFVCATLAKRIRRKTQFVSGNAAAETLWYMTKFTGRKEDLQHLLDSCYFFLDEYGQKDVLPSQTIASTAGVKIREKFCSQPSDLEPYLPLFVKHKPLFRITLEFLTAVAGGFDLSVFDIPRIQRTIDQKINTFEEKQGAVPSKPVVEVSHSVRNVDPPLVPPEPVPPSYSVQIDHLFSQDNLVDIIKGVVGEAAYQAGSRVSRTIIQVMSFLYSLYKATSVSQVISIATQFISGNDICWEFCMSRLTHVSEQLQGGKEDEQWDPMADLSSGFSEFKSHVWEAITGAGVFTFIQSLMGDVAKWIVEPVKELISATRLSLIRESSRSFALTIIEAIKTIMRRLYNCYQAKSFSPLWGESWDPVAWSTYCESYISHYIHLTASPASLTDAGKALKELRERGELQSFWTEPVTVAEYISRCDDLIMTGLKLLKYFQSDDIMKANLARCRNKLVDFVQPLRSKVFGAGYRVQPYALYVYGKTSVGKTNITSEIVKALRKRMSYSESGIFNKRPNQNFDTGLDHTMWCVDHDDVDQCVAPLAAGTPNHVESFVALVNNNPLPIEGAAIPDKGKLMAAPVLAVVKSNFIDFRAPDHIIDVDVFWRRLSMHVTVSPLPEFSNHGLLDGAAAAASTTWNMYDFHVRHFDPRLNGADRAIPHLTSGVHMRFTEFLEYFYKTFDEHMERQRALVAAVSENNGTCPICFMDMRKDCGHSSQWVDAMEKKLSENPEIPKSDYYIPKPFDIKESFVRLRERLEELTAPEPPPTVPPVLSSQIELQELRKEEELQGQAIGKPCRNGLRILTNLAVGEAISIGVEKLFDSHFWVTLGATLAVGGIVSSVISKVSSSFQGRVANSVEGLIPFNWLRAEQQYVPGVPPNTFTSTYTKEEMLIRLSKHFVKISGPDLVAYAIIVSHNSIIYPTHIAPIGSELVVKCQERDIKLQVTTFNSALLMNKELCLLKVPGLIGIGSLEPFIWKTEDTQVCQFDEVMYIGPHKTLECTTNRIARNQPIPELVSDASTVMGDCGGVYIGRIGKHWKIVAMHYKLITVTNVFGEKKSAIGALFSTLELERLAQTLATTLQGVTTEPLLLSKKGQVSLGHFPVKSEVWAAMSHHNATPYCFGTLDPPLTGSTMKTGLLQSLIAEDCRPLIEEWAGRFDYWQLPNFRGSMKDGKWTSPFTDAFQTENVETIDWEVMWMAILDYLGGMDSLDTQGYAELSEDQTIRGVPGSFIHRINTKTSVGPPFNQSKQLHVAIGEVDSYISPEVCKIIDALKDALEWSIPAAVAVCTLKDEPQKPDKFPRVFQVLSFAFNFLLKKKGSAWKSFMRANPDFFESCVGINMTGAECAKIVEALRTISKDLCDLYDADVKRIDKSFSGDLYESVALVIFAISFVIGVCPFDNYKLAQGLKHCRASIKNDLFCSFWNSSGNDWTVEINGILMSLGERYVFYYNNPHLRAPKSVLLEFAHNYFTNPVPSPDLLKWCIFRSHVVLRTYGDDALFATRMTLPPNYLEIWKSIGIIKTDADKANESLGVLKRKNLDGVQFLKRKIVWMSEVDRYVARLDKKSLARLLAIKKESSLSLPDHACEAMTECLRELVYYGKDDYNQAREIFKEIVVRRGFSGNNYLFLPEFNHYIEKIRQGEFSTWVDRSEIMMFTEHGSFIQVEMSMQGMVKTPNEGVPQMKAPGETASQAVVTMNETTDVTYDVGYIMSSGTHYEDVDNSESTYEQVMPKNSLTDYLTRFTKISSFTFSNANAAGTAINAGFDPLRSFLTNTNIASKISTFTYLRGTLEIMFVSAFPANSYGAFVVSAYPLGQGPIRSGGAPTPPPVNFATCLQVEHSQKVDVAGASNVTLRLPFLWPFDFLDIANYLSVQPIMWGLYYWSLAPVATAIPGGITSGQVAVYARLLPDYELVVPVVQGDRAPRAHPPRHRPTPHPTVSHARDSGYGSPDDEEPVAHTVPGIHKTKPSEVAAKVADVADKLAKVPIIGPYAEVAGKAAKGAKKLASFFGFTRDDHETVPTWVNGRPFSNPAHVDGEDTSDIISLVQNNALSIDPRFAGGNQTGDDPTAFADLFKHWTIVKTMSWASTATSGTVLGSLPITPFYGLGSNTTTTMTWNPTVAGYIGYPFTYWRGDMEYKIIIPVSKLHRGTLQIYWSPFQSGATADPTNNSMNCIYDVAADEEKQVRVGYAREVPFLEVLPLIDAVTITPLGATNGRLFFQVVNPLTSQNVGSVSIIVLARAASNMEFALPRATLPMYESTGLVYTDGNQVTITYQGASGDDETGPDPFIDLVPGTGEYSSDLILFGEKIKSVRALLQKPCYVLPNLGANGKFQIIPHGNFNTTAAVEQSPMTFSTYYSKIFVGMAGSFRVKLLGNGVNQLYCGYISGPGSQTGGVPQCISSLASYQTAPNGGAEFKFPYYVPAKYLPTRGTSMYASVYETPQSDYVVHTAYDGTTIPAPRVFLSWGPDVRPGCFSWTPQLLLTYAAPGPII